VLLVVRENLARREMVRAARDQLAAVNVVPLGVVVNRAHAFEGQRYYEQLAREVGRRGSSV
jgi:Mrp family chromosome partitioning ATPase